MMTFADLFSGCGGLSHGFYHNSEFHGLLAVDSWSAARRVFADNHPKMAFEERDLHSPDEVQAVVGQLEGRCDVLLGGPPCQGFSTLGKRRDGDRRSSLVDVFLEIAKRIAPRVVLIENVKGIASKRHSLGHTYAEHVEQTLSSSDGWPAYRTSSRLIDMQEFGLAQTRTRWFLVGVRDDVPHSDVLLQAILDGVDRRRTDDRPTLADAIGDLPHLEAGGGDEVSILNEDSGPRVIYNHRAMNHSARLVERLRHVPPGGGLLNVPANLLTPHLRRMIAGKYGSGGHVKNIYGRMEWDKPSGTIVAGMDKITCGRFVHPVGDRLLTPRECARIQSFPDDFRFRGGMVQQYYLIGNAVPPILSRIFAESIAEAFRTSKDEHCVLKHNHVRKIAVYS